MSKHFRAWKIDEVQLLPASVQDYVPSDHLSRLIVSLVRESLDLSAIESSYSSAAQLQRSREPHPEDQGGVHPGLQWAGRGRRRPSDHRRADADQQLQRSGATGAAARWHQGQSRQEPRRSVGRCRLLLGCQPSHRREAAHRGLYRHRPTETRHQVGHDEQGSPPASPIARMSTKLKRAGHRSRYRLRKQIVEPVFGQIKQARGFGNSCCAASRK